MPDADMTNGELSHRMDGIADGMQDGWLEETDGMIMDRNMSPWHM